MSPCCFVWRPAGSLESLVLLLVASGKRAPTEIHQPGGPKGAFRLAKRPAQTQTNTQQQHRQMERERGTETGRRKLVCVWSGQTQTLLADGAIGLLFKPANTRKVKAA